MCPIAFYHHAKNYKLSMSGFRESAPKSKFLTLNPQIKISFQNSNHVTFFTLLIPNFMQNFRKSNERSPTYLKTNRHTDGQMEGPQG